MPRQIIYSVSIMMSPKDNGFCVSFVTRQQAEACAANARVHGAYHVHVWEA